MSNASEPVDGEWISIAATAIILSVCERTVRSYIARGILPASRIGGTRTTRIRRADIADAMRAIPTADKAS
jgi:excisionase family DNA binding protein